MALATLLATRLMVTQDNFLTMVDTEREMLRARQLAQGGVDWARAVLLEDMLSSNVDHLDEPWAREVPVVEAEGGQLGGRLTDAQARFNINDLIDGAGQAVDRDTLAVYRRLLAAVQLDGALAGNLADWMLQASRRAGAAAGAPPGQRAYFSTADLALVPGYTAAARERLQPYLVALPALTPININTADAPVLAAAADVSADAAARIVQMRTAAWFRDGADFANRAKPATAAGRLWATRSDFFEAQVTARHGDAQVMTRTLLRRQPERGRVDIAAVQFGGA
jgi:general secretion pathway protein K